VTRAPKAASLRPGDLYDLDWAKADPDMAPLHEDPRFQAVIAEAEARLAAAEATATAAQ
jgi:hypothetical protein